MFLLVNIRHTSHLCPDQVDQPVQGPWTSECPQIGYRDRHAAGDRDGSISCNIRIASTARTGSCLMRSRSSDRALSKVSAAPGTYKEDQGLRTSFL